MGCGCLGLRSHNDAWCCRKAHLGFRLRNSASGPRTGLPLPVLGQCWLQAQCEWTKKRSRIARAEGPGSFGTVVDPFAPGSRPKTDENRSWKPGPGTGNNIVRHQCLTKTTLETGVWVPEGSLARFVWCHEMALELLCRADFWCNRHCRTSPVDLEGFWAQVWPKMARKPARKFPAGLPSGTQYTERYRWDPLAPRALRIFDRIRPMGGPSPKACI